MTEKIIIRELKTSDYRKLAEFNSNFPGDSLSVEQWLERFKYWWDENPAFIDSWHRGFILLDNFKIVGFVGSFPTLFKTGNEIIRVFNGTTWRVLDDYRNFSIELWEYNRRVSSHYISFNTTPTEFVSNLIRKFHYKLLPWGSEQESFYVVDPNNFLKSRKLPLAILLRPLLYILIIVRQSCIRSLKIPYEYIELNEADAFFDELWINTSRYIKYTNVRDCNCVNWYSHNKILMGIYCQGHLIGYSIFMINGRTENYILQIVDFWVDHSYNLDQILSGFLQAVRVIALERKCYIIKFPHFSKEINRSFTKIRLLKHNIKRSNFFFIPHDIQDDFNTGNSYFTLLQGDYGS
ncbi:MAG TPA: hypothetical protein PKJ14_01795 [Candidatus Cloacimonadota bacterium]|nr:hypothetical protein [Candidatus Cloacimonadota bacterium]HQL14408.1 hypothetical protein [Candidatus Cloacimonadota bacterium]